MRHTRLIAAGLVLVLAAVLGLLAWSLPAGNPATGLAQISREEGGDAAITVTVTRAEDAILDQPGHGPDLAAMKGRVLPFAIALDTHAGDISKLDLNGRVFLRDSSGMEIPGMARQISADSHHTAFAVAFPKLDSQGRPLDDPAQKRITLLVRGVGAANERILEWELAQSSPLLPRALGLGAALALILGGWLGLPPLLRRRPAASGAPRTRWIAVAAMAALTLLLSVGWLLMALAAGKDGLRAAVTTSTSVQASSSQAVTRTGYTESKSKVQATFATPEYYAQSGQTELGQKLEADKYLVFLITEDHYDSKTPAAVPALAADGVQIDAPATEQVLVDSDHHRTRVIRFARHDAQGLPYLANDARLLELKWPGMRLEHDANHNVANPLRWTLPIAFAPVTEKAPLSPWLFLTLTAGLFAALSPCLIQLTVYYLSTLAGVSLATDAPRSGPQWPVIRTALWFVAGVVIAYTAGGALAGTVGKYLQESGVLGAWNRPVSIAAGAAIVIMGLYTGAAARAPMICKLPLPRMTRFAHGKGGPGTMVMGAAIALGCLQCFGGAIFASLLAYVGSLGSPLLGAGMLFLFSLGVAVPFLLSAFAWSRVAPHLARLERVTPLIALGSSLIMVSLGLLMIADRFHWVSNLVLRLFPFLQA